MRAWTPTFGLRWHFCRGFSLHNSDNQCLKGIVKLLTSSLFQSIITALWRKRVFWKSGWVQHCVTCYQIYGIMCLASIDEYLFVSPKCIRSCFPIESSTCHLREFSHDARWKRLKQRLGGWSWTKFAHRLITQHQRKKIIIRTMLITVIVNEIQLFIDDGKWTLNRIARLF